MGYLILLAVIFGVGYMSGYSSGASIARRRLRSAAESVRDFLQH